MTFDPDYKERAEFNSQVDNTTKVVNLKLENYDVYIGRSGHGQDGYFGNLHFVRGICPICKIEHNRDQAIAAFKKDFYRRIMCDSEYLKRVIELKGKKLGCFCKPAYACHGDIIAEFVNSLP